MLKSLLIVGAGGMIGSMLRYYMFLVTGNQSFPYATLLVNIAGSLFIGIVSGLAVKHAGFENNWRLFLATGVCGGFTTFSAFSLECVHLVQQQRFYSALLYILLSITIGILATFSGLMLTK